MKTQRTICAADAGGVIVEYAGITREEAARRYVEDGEYQETRTTWVTVTTWPEDDPDDVEDHLVAVEPAVPPCTDGEGHDWQAPHSIVGGIEESPGVWGHGGGVVYWEVCMRCGCGRMTDTWAQDPETGRQGLHAVEYERGRYEAVLEEYESADD